MPPGPQGSFPLFHVRGINVYVHWAWILAVAYLVQYDAHSYSNIVWKIVECLALFLIVLLHEFGHALATRQVGGTADRILLWPLGGVAYVSPPPRPGAELWSIAAGPLVNVVLFFILTGIAMGSGILSADRDLSDAETFLFHLWRINLTMLIFNMLPVYPLDGGQILRSLLWFILGRARSMHVAAIIGFIGVAGLATLALYEQSLWLGVVTFYIFQNCQRGWAHAKALTELERQPRRAGYACPSCHVAPPIGALWRCPQCGTAFDTFETQAVCPNCHVGFSATRCLDCHASNPIANWSTPPDLPVSR